MADNIKLADQIKLALACLLVAAGVAGFYYFSESSLFIKVLMVLAGLLAGAGVALLTLPGREFAVFAREAVDETKKVVWPNRKETVQTTGYVFLFVVVMALFLWVVDWGLLWVVKLLMGRSE